MGEITRIKEYLSEVETTREHNGYFFSVGEALTVVILGTLCGLKNVSQISQWSEEESVRGLLAKHLGIKRIPCYYWLLCLLKLIDLSSLNQCLMRWAQSLIPDGKRAMTISFDGKTIRSTGKMSQYQSPVHIVSAHLAEFGITLAGVKVEEKSNEIPAVRELIGLLNLEGCMVVADALNCQKETAKAIIDAKADYLLNVKDNHSTLKEDIEDYVQDNDLRKTMDTSSTLEKSRERIEKRTAFVTNDTDWLYGKDEWVELACIGAIHTQFTTLKGTSNEWHYYISSRNLTADELLKHARLEWSVETMHWLLDVHYLEDSCRIEDKHVQQNINMVRKLVLNSIKFYKNTSGDKHPISKIMFDCLLDPFNIVKIIQVNEN